MEIAISIISAVIALASAVASILFSCKTQKQYLKSIEPALSFNLFRCDPYLYLQVTNTGQSPATEIRIKVKEIINNGEINELSLDKVYDTDFDLYPTERTQGRVAICGENIIEHVFPRVSIYVEYKDKATNREHVYNRTIIYNPSLGETVRAKVDMNLKDIQHDIHTMAKANLRTANYLDGYQVLEYDDFNIIADRSLYNDLVNVSKGKEESNIKSRNSILDKIASKR